MKVPRFSLSELFYWGGLIAGIGISHTIMTKAGYGGIPVLLVSIACGVGLGWLLETIHKGGSMPPPPD